MTAGERVRQAVLTAGAVLGSVGILVVTGLWLTDTRMLVVQSDSMAPAIAAGDLVLVQPVPSETVRRGDVVSVLDDAGVRVTHRVEQVTGAGDQRTLQLRGDANHMPDPQVYRVAQVDRATAVVPRAGSVVSALASPPARWVAAGAVLTCWTAVLAPRLGRRRQRGERRALPAATGVVAAALVVPLILPSDRAWAVFTDHGTLQSESLTAHRVVSQAQPTCSNYGFIFGGVDLQWTHQDVRYEYSWQATRVDNGSSVGSGVVRTTDPAGRLVTVRLDPSSFSFSQSGVQLDIGVRARLQGTPTWAASTSTVTRVHTAGITDARVRCGS